ncbi:GntR family transcriptional regulator [Salsipaludibacter albus]|uniref:GntR family transcriptional regulator n=1 Tax=Salsipaludibacter albus TaxID=2849650 RepID=UPI001EE4B93A
MTTTSTERGSVADAIRALVVTREFQPGDRLAEADLAARLDVSRTPVREALRQLAADGMVEHVPNKGARVVALSPAELEHVFELRARVEGTAASAAAVGATGAELDRLDELAEEIARHGLPGPDQALDRVYGCNADFHLLLAESSRSSVIAASVRQLFHTAATVRTYQGFDEASVRRSVAHHREIVAALRARDGEWARSTMHSHLANARAALLGPRPVAHSHDTVDAPRDDGADDPAPTRPPS